MSRLVSAFAWLAALIAFLDAPGSLIAQMPTPESVLGHKPGDDFYLANYEESLDYFRKLAAASDKIKLFNVGQTSEGRDWYIAVISSAENLRNLDRYREIGRRVSLVKGLGDSEARELAREGKVIVHIDGGLHATEVASAQHTIQLAYNLVSGDNDAAIRRILDSVILVLWFSMNPDGQDAVVSWYRRNLGTPYEVSPLPWLYQKYVGHDNNRDGYMNNMIESRVVTRAILDQWFPMILFCHHQTAPFPTRIWLPPFAEPASSNMHPLMYRWLSLIGSAMAVYLDQHDMPGATQFGNRLDDWYPGYNDGIYNYRNIIAFWTETALYRYATPHFYTVQDFPRENQELRKQIFYSSPWQGGWWRLADAVRYMIGASMGTLDFAARYRDELIFNRYQTGREVIERFTKEPPFAFVVPRQQRDPQTAALLLEKMRFDGIEVSQATEPFKANGREYPAGTWVVLMDQPYANLVKDLFETQRYPDLRESPEGPPQMPYDVAGWTVPLQMGVEVAAVTSPLSKDVRSKFRLLDKVVPPDGSVTGSGSSFVVDHRSNASFKAINRILRMGARVSLVNKEMTLSGVQYEPGAFVITGIEATKMQSLASDLALKVQATDKITEPMTPIATRRIALYNSWMANIDEGWTDWVLAQHEFPHSMLHNADIRAGHLEEQFDAIIVAEMPVSAIMDGHAVGTVPGEYVGGIGNEGLANLKLFVRSGGTLITLGNSCLFAIDKFNLPVKNVLSGLKSQEFSCSGSILHAETKEPGHPVLFGLPSDLALFFARNPAFEVQKDFKGSVLIEYPKDESPLLSGYLLHGEKIQGKAAALDAVYGKGHIVLLGFRPQWRGQSWGTFKLLFNSVLYGEIR
ncbi:MAG TPA: M14 metallopeptidase family protein [Acidobacteriota bacterium]|nr:M14 metallopeptidase family protein [Acidobacteriota bacterium]